MHAALHPFVIFLSVELAPPVLGFSIGVRSGFPKIFEFPFRWTGRVARLRGSILGCADGGVNGDLLVIDTLIFQGCGKINQIGTLIVPLSGILVAGVQVDHLSDEGTGVESRSIFDSFAALVI